MYEHNVNKKQNKSTEDVLDVVSEQYLLHSETERMNCIVYVCVFTVRRNARAHSPAQILR